MGYSPPHTTPHGQKRQPDNEIDHEQRLSKRFNLLNLEQNGSKLYIPVKSEAESSRPSPPRRRRSNAVTDSMPVDDSKERVYIHNLDEEIADIESEDEKVIFLPDIERHLMKIPKSVLTGGALKPGLDNQMIIYGVPGSISVPEEQDAVRKAIEEARRRAQEQADQDMQPDLEAASGARTRLNYGEADQDAMDTE